MSFCPQCGTPMKPLFVGEYCPNDCDRAEDKTPVLAKGKAEILWEGYICIHPNPYYASHGKVTGWWCWDCGDLLSEVNP